MPLTVERLAADRTLGLTLVAGHAGRDRVIEWAHVIELLDPTPWLEGDELIMTLGLNLPDDESSQSEYVGRLASAGVAGLALDTGHRHKRVPAGVRRAGDALGLPVLAVAPETPFMAISKAVSSELTADQLREVQRLSANQERLASAALRKGTPGVLQMLSRTLSTTVLLLDGQGRTLDAVGAGAGQVEARVAALLDLDQGGPRRASFTHLDDTGHLTVQTLAMPSQRHGYLALASPRPFDANDRLLVGHAVTLVSIALEKPSQVMEVEMRLKRGVFRALLRLGQDADMGLTRFFGFPSDSPVGVLVLRDVGPLRAAELAVTERLAEEQAPFLCTNVKDGLAVLLPAAGLPERSRRVYASVRTTLSRSISGGVGNPVGLAQAADSLRQAATAARVGSVQGHVLVQFSDLGIFDLLLSTQSRDTLQAIASSVLRPIEEFDSAQRGDLIRSTSEFLMHNGQWEAASAALGVHRHTLRNRIDRVSELLGRDMEAAHTRSEVWLALKAREVLGMDSLLPAEDLAGGGGSDLGDQE